MQKELGSHFTATLYAENILQTSRAWLETTVPHFYYATKTYPDSPVIGLSIRYTLTGKAYKSHQNTSIDDSAIDRLGS